MPDLAGFADLDEMRPGFFGQAKLRSLLAIRVFDLWAHEQDLRRALGEPGGFGGIPAAHSRERMLMGAGQHHSGAAQPGTAGTTCSSTSPAREEQQRSILFDGERGRAGMDIPEMPTTTLRLDLNTLTVLACGRSDDPRAARALLSKVSRTSGGSVIEDLAVTP